MPKEFNFTAPNGAELQGTNELIPAAYRVVFLGPDPSEYDHTGDNNEFGDGIETQTLCGASLFTDRNGEDWPAHHLIPDGADALSTETLDLFRREFVLGEALDAAMASLASLRGALKVIGSETPETSELIAGLTRFTERDREHSPPRRASSLFDYLAGQYAAAKAASIAAKERELQAQAEASPRVECGNCDWTGRERDCDEIQDIGERVSAGETMPAGECPECGALCHLAEKEEA